MRIQLDTDRKTIKVEQDVLLSKLVATLEALLPKGEWKKFTLETNTIIKSWIDPIIIHDHYHPRPYYGPWFTASGNSNMSLKADNSLGGSKLNTGLYNVEVKS